MPRQLAEHPDPLAERRQSELGQDAIEGFRTRCALPDLVEVTRDRRGRGELDQGLEEVERVVVPRRGSLALCARS